VRGLPGAQARGASPWSISASMASSAAWSGPTKGVASGAASSDAVRRSNNEPEVPWGQGRFTPLFPRLMRLLPAAFPLPA